MFSGHWYVDDGAGVPDCCRLSRVSAFQRHNNERKVLGDLGTTKQKQCTFVVLETDAHGKKAAKVEYWAIWFGNCVPQNPQMIDSLTSHRLFTYDDQDSTAIRNFWRAGSMESQDQKRKVPRVPRASDFSRLSFVTAGLPDAMFP